MMTMTRSEDRVIVQTYADGDDAPSEVRHRWQLAGMGSLRWSTGATTDRRVNEVVDEESASLIRNGHTFFFSDPPGT